MQPYYSKVANFFKNMNLNEVGFEYLRLYNSNRGCLNSY